MVDLTTVGFEKGIHYETIITTMNNGKANSAPIGIICLGKDAVMCRIFDKSTTLENIKETGEFIVNVIDNPLAFTYSILSTVPDSFLNDDGSVKCSNSCFRCEVTSIRDVIKDNDPIDKSKKSIIKAQAKEIKINKEGKPLNRAMGLLVDSIYNIGKIDENTEYYMKCLHEAKRVITKVGSREEKKAIKLITEHLKNEGHDL